MADPISAEPKNWEEDILLKISMPGKTLRDTTKLKIKQSEARMAAMNKRNEAPKKEDPVLELRNQNINQQPHQPQPATQSNPQVQTNREPQNIEAPQSQDIPQEEISQEEPQETIQETLLDIEEPEQVQETQIEEQFQIDEPMNIEQDMQESNNTDNTKIEEVQEEPKSQEPEPISNVKIDFIVKGPEKIKIMTIETEKEETIRNVPPHLSNSIDIKKIENFANKLIGSDLYRKKN